MHEPEFEQKDFTYLQESCDGVLIQAMARGMNQSEVSDYFGIELEHLQKAETDWKFFSYHYRIGRSQGRKSAVDSLFKQMDQRSGGQVCLSYLARFGEEWAGELDADSEQKGKKSFRVILD